VRTNGERCATFALGEKKNDLFWCGFISFVDLFDGH